VAETRGAAYARSRKLLCPQHGRCPFDQSIERSSNCGVRKGHPTVRLAVPVRFTRS